MSEWVFDSNRNEDQTARTWSTSRPVGGLTLEQLLAAAADPRLDLPDPAVLADPKDQSVGAAVGTQ